MHTPCSLDSDLMHVSGNRCMVNRRSTQSTQRQGRVCPPPQSQHRAQMWPEATPSLRVSLLRPSWAFNERGLNVEPYIALYCSPRGCGRSAYSLCLPGKGLEKEDVAVLLDAPMLVLATEVLVGFCFVLFFLLRLSLANAKGKATIYIHVSLSFLSPSFLSSSVFFIYQRIRCLQP